MKDKIKRNMGDLARREILKGTTYILSVTVIAFIVGLFLFDDWGTLRFVTIIMCIGVVWGYMLAIKINLNCKHEWIELQYGLTSEKNMKKFSYAGCMVECGKSPKYRCKKCLSTKGVFRS